MIQEHLEKIESKLSEAKNVPGETRAELLGLLSALKTEIAALATTHDEDARKIARFTHASAEEATRLEKKPGLAGTAVQELTESVEGFEVSHPGLVATVNRLAVILSNMGI
jgi:hypothetical protein